MPSLDWQRIEAIFQAALDVPGEQRRAWLADHCGHDLELHREVESLLSAEIESADFLRGSYLPQAAALLAASETEADRVGQYIGPYRILEELGRGGMGVVFLAAREDEQFRQRVAIKIVKRGLDTEDILRRFRNERQILASLHHPSIAQLFDGGATESGLPYFVLEYIEGEPLDRYCDEHKLPTAERLQLFRKVCAAVQYAHQNLIVHRDLKPSNILVTAEGEPKLLDFGIAKLLNPELSGPNVAQTATSMRLMTPDYASPEQIRGERITTASDVYSLGVLLYRLLTGHAPYRFANSSPQEIERLICKAEPEKPSTAVSRVEEITTPKGLTSITPESVGLARDEQPETLRRTLQGDLDNIVLMAMSKETDRRYISAAQLSDDIRRYLHSLPVTARPNTLGYRASKFVARNRVGVAAAALVVLAVVGGLVGTAWQARAAARERDQARLEKVRAENVSAFLKRLLKYTNPVLTPAKGSEETSMADMLDEAARRLDSSEFASQPEVRAELEQIIAISYNFQGKYDLARKHLHEYIVLQTRLFGENDPKTLAALEFSAQLLFIKGEIAESENLYRRVLPLMRDEQRRGILPVETLAGALNNFGYLRRTQGDSKEAESMFREALNLSRELPEESRYIIGLTRSTLASTLADQGKFEEALQTAREAVAEYRQHGKTDAPDFGFTLTILGGFLTEKGELAAADANLQEAEAIFRKRLNPLHLWLGDNLRNQAMLLYQREDYQEAMNKVDETLNIYRESFGKHYDHYPTVLMIQGLIFTKTGKANEGEPILREALRIRVESLPKGHYWIDLAKSALSECLTSQKRYAEAEALLIESYTALTKTQGPENPRTLLARRRLVELYQKWNKPELVAKYR